jgi:hypothetical protein
MMGAVAVVLRCVERMRIAVGTSATADKMGGPLEGQGRGYGDYCLALVGWGGGVSWKMGRDNKGFVT